MNIWKADDLDLRHLVTGSYSYAPKNIHVEAIFVTLENIGALSLEFEVDLEWSDEKGPYFYLRAWRDSANNMVDYLILTVRPDFWMVPLRGEIHLFDDVSFTSTFWDDEEEAKLKDYAKKDVAASAELYSNPYQPLMNVYVDAMQQTNIIKDPKGLLRPSVPAERTFPYQQPLEQKEFTGKTYEQAYADNNEKFKQNDRVRVVNTDRLGTVTMVNVEQNAKLCIEALMDRDNMHYLFLPEQLEVLDVPEAIKSLVQKMQTPPEGLRYKIGDWVNMGTRGSGEILNVDHNGAAYIRVHHNTPKVGSYWFRSTEIGDVIPNPELQALREKLLEDDNDVFVEGYGLGKILEKDEVGRLHVQISSGDHEGSTFWFEPHEVSPRLEDSSEKNAD